MRKYLEETELEINESNLVEKNDLGLRTNPARGSDGCNNSSYNFFQGPPGVGFTNILLATLLYTSVLHLL